MSEKNTNEPSDPNANSDKVSNDDGAPRAADITYESHSYYARIGLEFVLLLYVVLIVLFRFQGMNDSSYRAEQLKKLQTEIEQSIKDQGIDAQNDKFKTLVKEKISVSKMIDFHNIPAEKRYIDQLTYKLVCDDFKKLAKCWGEIESTSISVNLLNGFKVSLLFVLVLGYLRIFMGTHFIDKDVSFQKSIRKSGMKKRLQIEAALRLLLYGTSLILFYSLVMGNSSTVYILLWAQCILLISYLILFYKALTEDEESNSSIFFTDFLYILIIILFSLTSFDSYINLIKPYTDWYLLGYSILCIFFLVSFFKECKNVYWKTISEEIIGWLRYTFLAEGSVRVIGPWEVKSVEPVPQDKEESFTHSVEFKSKK